MRFGSPWLIGGLMLATLLAFFVARRGGDERHAYASCMTTAECLKGEVCAVTPKDDGFASLGVCTTPCAEDGSGCLNGWRCAGFVDLGQWWVPGLTREGKGARTSARALCVPPAR